MIRSDIICILVVGLSAKRLTARQTNSTRERESYRKHSTDLPAGDLDAVRNVNAARCRQRLLRFVFS
jgi:hypothetical protein